MGKAQSLSHEAYLAHELVIAGIGKQGIELRINPQEAETNVVFVVRCVEPLEGMIPVSEIGIEFRDPVGEVVAVRFILRTSQPTVNECRNGLSLLNKRSDNKRSDS